MGHSGLGRASEATHPPPKEVSPIWMLLTLGTSSIHLRTCRTTDTTGSRGLEREQTIGRRPRPFVDLLFLVQVHGTHLDSALEAGRRGRHNKMVREWMNGLPCAGTWSAFCLSTSTSLSGLPFVSPPPGVIANSFCGQVFPPLGMAKMGHVRSNQGRGRASPFFSCGVFFLSATRIASPFPSLPPSSRLHLFSGKDR